MVVYYHGTECHAEKKCLAVLKDKVKARAYIIKI